MNAGAITAIRTAAVSAVATRLLARPGVAHARDPRRRHAGALPPRGDARRAPLRARARLEPHARPRRRACPASRRSARPREALARRRRRRHRDLGARADRRARLARRGRPRERGRLEHPDHARARHARRWPTAALFVDRRESTLDGVGRLPASPPREGAIGPESIRAEIGELLIGAAERPPLRRRADGLQVARPRRRGPRAPPSTCSRARRGQDVGVEVEL